MVFYWILIGSVICSVFYALVMADYMNYYASPAEYVFPTVAIWNVLGERGTNLAIKIIITSLLSVILFAYVLGVFLFLIIFIVIYALWSLIERIFKRKGKK